MTEEWSQIAANGIIHEARMAFAEWQAAAWDQTRPSVLYRPTVSLDGDHYCALYGDDLMSGCAGFGKTMAEAMADFDKNWSSQQAPALNGGSPNGK